MDACLHVVIFGFKLKATLPQQKYTRAMTALNCEEPSILAESLP